MTITSSMGGVGFPFTSANQFTSNDVVPEAVITIGNVIINDHLAQYINDGPDTAIWTSYQIHNHYEQDRHTYMLPIASPAGFQGGSAAFCQLAAPTLLWIADWTAARFGLPPIAPSLQPTDKNWVLLDVHLEPVELILDADGNTPHYRLTGTYIFGHRQPNDSAFQNISFGRPPYVADTFPRSYPTGILQQKIIDQ